MSSAVALSILCNQSSHPYRQRFTTAHELAHFMIPTHIPDKPGRFLCSRADMMRLSAKEGDRRARMEVKANRFSSLILIPPPALRLALFLQLARDFEVSKEAMARAYAERHDEILAIVIAQNRKVLRCYRDRMRFPFIKIANGQPVPPRSLFFRGSHNIGVVSDFDECLPDVWIEVRRGERAPELSEQIYLQQGGFAMIMLRLMKPDDEEEANLERSWEPRFRR